jgi:protein-tyrosine phosphatase
MTIHAHALPDVGGHPDRLVALEAVHNFRDLGGYPTADGRVTRWRHLYRADGLHRLAGRDLDVIRGLGLRTVIDLRRPEEIDERGAFPVHDHPVQLHHLSVLDVRWADKEPPSFDDDADFLHWAYLDMLASGGANFAAAIELLAVPDALPAVFHCAAGKDRTGLLAMLVLGALGVTHEYITADYALTAEGMARMFAWYEREQPDQFALREDVPSAFLLALPAAMARVVDDLCAEHGSLRGYVGSLGVSAATLDRLERELLDDAL